VRWEVQLQTLVVAEVCQYDMGDIDGTPPANVALAAINSTLNSGKAQYLILPQIPFLLVTD